MYFLLVDWASICEGSLLPLEIFGLSLVARDPIAASRRRSEHCSDSFRQAFVLSNRTRPSAGSNEKRSFPFIAESPHAGPSHYPRQPFVAPAVSPEM
jgi:hypothetical protein